ncbi:hypothetical protein BGZ50_001263 [Haplosporangium sp. Z 11]|nr:hypothetical protein BGZ50_001263 [Haplosporangium sp. Z 11]
MAISPLFFLIAAVLLLTFSSTTSAQSDKCHACIRKAIPSVSACAALTPTQVDTLDKVITGQEAFSAVETYRTQDPSGYECLVALMWDIVEYKGQLWAKCLDPANSCPWAEMMQWLEIIPKIASIYGFKNPPAQVLKNAPA